MLEQIAQKATDYLGVIISPIVNSFDIDQKIDDRGILLSINLPKEDMGKVIGKNGETIKAIRRLVKQFGMSNQANVAVKVNEPNV